MAGHAGDLGEGALGDLKNILADTLSRIRDEVFAPGRDPEAPADAAGPSAEAGDTVQPGDTVPPGDTVRPEHTAEPEAPDSGQEPPTPAR